VNIQVLVTAIEVAEIVYKGYKMNMTLKHNIGVVINKRRNRK